MHTYALYAYIYSICIHILYMHTYALEDILPLGAEGLYRSLSEQGVNPLEYIGEKERVSERDSESKSESERARERAREERVSE